MRNESKKHLIVAIGVALAVSLLATERTLAGCPNCDVCATATGDCFEINDTPGCDDTVSTTGDCCELVCTADSWCCDNPWDNICVSTAFDVCNLPLGACCNFDGSCSNDTQQRFCKYPLVWYDGQTCAEIECVAVPTVSEWGIVVMTLLGLTLGTLIYRGRAAELA